MVELFLTDWCRGSEGIRVRLGELGIDFVARRVPDDPAERDALEAVTGVRAVPVLLLEDGSVLDGTERILEFLASLTETELPSAECDSTPSSRAPESPLAGVPMS